MNRAHGTFAVGWGLRDEDGDDLRILADSGAQAARIASAPSLHARGATVEAATEMTEEALREHVRASLRCYFHPVGTCALGRVVGGDGGVRGLEGVHVADCSIMPAIPRANTHLSALAVAERLADRLR